MKKRQEEQLEDYLWELTQAIGSGIPGLPENWMQRRVEDLANIFRPAEAGNTK